jgi:hypothetical protein
VTVGTPAEMAAFRAALTEVLATGPGPVQAGSRPAGPVR